MNSSRGLQEAISDRNADNTLASLAHGRPVSATCVLERGGRPAMTRLLDAGYVRRHHTHYLVITDAGRAYLGL